MSEGTRFVGKEQQDNALQLEAQLAGFARLGALNEHMSTTAYPDRLSERLEDRAQTERDGILSVEIERTAVIVLCTGGPHCEIRWPEGRNPYAVCYGWFGGDKVERGLTDDERAGLEMAVGDWEMLAMVDDGAE